MSNKVKYAIVAVLVLVLIAVVVALSWTTSKKAVSGPNEAPPPPGAEEAQKKGPEIGRFDVGEFVATSRDDDLHYIKIEVQLGYMGDLEKELTTRKSEIRDAIVTILMKMTVQRAKEDYIDKFLHKDIEKKVNELLGATTANSRVVQVWIPQFLIN